MSHRQEGVRIRIPRKERPRIEWGSWRKGFYAAGSLLLLAVLLGGHIFYWYVPRPRPAVPKGDLLPSRLLDSAELPFAVWVPYPHQNLAVLEKAVAETSQIPASQVVSALTRLARAPRPQLPSFGAFRLPPSRALTLATDEDSERFAVAAEVYPTVAAFAKLAGRLADNPWLRGGELTIEGRRIKIAWYGRVWTVSSPGLPELASTALATEDPPSLLIVEARGAKPPLPAGRFHLSHRGQDLVLASREALSEPPELQAPDLSAMGLFLLVVSGGSADEDAEPIQAMAFFDREDPLRFSSEGVTYEFPGTAAIFETGRERWSLPGESLLKWSGRKARGAEVGRFSIAALDRRSFRRIERLVPRLAPLVRPHPQGRLRWGLWFDLDTGIDEISRISQALEEIPLVSRRTKERWNDAARVLAPIADHYSNISLIISEEPPRLHLRLAGR